MAQSEDVSPGHIRIRIDGNAGSAAPSCKALAVLQNPPAGRGHGGVWSFVCTHAMVITLRQHTQTKQRRWHVRSRISGRPGPSQAPDRATDRLIPESWGELARERRSILAAYNLCTPPPLKTTHMLKSRSVASLVTRA